MPVYYTNMGTVFSSYDIRGQLNDSLTVEYAWLVGQAFSEWLSGEGQIVAIIAEGANSQIFHAITEGLLLQGRNVTDCGQCDESAITNAIQQHSAAGCVMVSHDSVQNTEIITLYDEHGVAITADRGLMEIVELVASSNFLPAASKGILTNL